MAYADKRDGKHTGSFVGEWPKGGKKRRFKTLQDAKDYETFTKLMGREPPTIEDGQHQSPTGAPTFAQVTEMAKADRGPKGKWKSSDHTLMQHLAYNCGIIGSYEIQRVTRSVLKKITDSLERAKAPGKSHLLTNATKNRYLTAASGVLRYAVNEEIIETMPSVPWLPEKDQRKVRDILQWGQDDVVLKLMRDAGHEVEALCAEVLIWTGLRSGELLRRIRPEQITTEQVQDEDGTDVRVGVIWLGKGQTKNNHARSVVFPVDLAIEIRAHIAAGTLPSGDKLLDTFKEACDRAGYTGNLVIHSLRHTRNTRLRKSGAELKIRRDMLGHISDEANEIYDHTDLEDQLQVVKRLREYAGKRAKRAQMTTSQVIDFVKAGAG
jgi:integrase